MALQESQFIPAGELNFRHLGCRIHIALQDGSECTGYLIQVSHEAALVSDATFGNPDSEVIGDTWTALRFQGWGDRKVPHYAKVEILPI